MLNIKNGGKYILIAALLFSVITVVINLDFIQFEYYAWNLSSETVETREEAAQNIISLGDKAIPFLVKKLDNHFIFESFYAVYCLEEITRAFDYNRYETDLYNYAIPYWKNWYNQNKDKY